MEMISETQTRDSQETLSTQKLQRTMILCVIGVALFAFNLFSLQPWLAASGHERASFLLYLVIRVLAYVGLSYFLVRWARHSRFQAMSTVMWVGVVDQVIFKFIATKAALVANPSLAGDGGPPTDGMILFGMAQGFLFFAPILLILAFLGVELNRFRRDWNQK